MSNGENIQISIINYVNQINEGRAYYTVLYMNFLAYKAFFFLYGNGDESNHPFCFPKLLVVGPQKVKRTNKVDNYINIIKKLNM